MVRSPTRVVNVALALLGSDDVGVYRRADMGRAGQNVIEKMAAAVEFWRNSSRLT